MGINYSPKIVTDGLVLCLDAANPLSYTSGDSVWKDLSGLGGSAVAYNSPIYNSNGYFTFNNFNDYFRFTRTDLNGGTFAYGQITCELWYMPSENGDSGLTNNNLITVENSFEISVGNNGNGYHGLHYASVPWAWYGTAANVLTNSQWNMISFVHSSSGRWLYVNGAQIFARADTGNISSGNSSYPYLTLMGRYGGTASPAEGSLAYIRLYNRPLNLDEINDNYLATKGRFGL